MYYVRLYDVRLYERCGLVISAYYLQKSVAVVFVTHTSRRKVSRDGMVVVVHIVDSADECVIAVVVTLGYGRRSYKCFRNRVAEIDDGVFIVVFGLFVARHERHGKHRNQKRRETRERIFFIITP